MRLIVELFKPLSTCMRCEYDHTLPKIVPRILVTWETSRVNYALLRTHRLKVTACLRHTRAAWRSLDELDQLGRGEQNEA